MARIVGIDFGGSELRAAVECDGSAVVIRRGPGPALPFRTLEPTIEEPGGSVIGYRLVSLKRRLDFDTDWLGPAARRDSVGFLADAFAVLCTECSREVADDSLNCVVTVPPCFSQRQRSAIRTAAEMAGFCGVRLVDDTLAALLASKDTLGDRECVLVYSWGATAFSVCLYRAKGAGFVPADNAQEGDNELGGHDLESFVANRMAAAMIARGMTLERQPVLNRLAERARGVAWQLAGGDDVSIPIGQILGADAPAVDETISLDGEECESFVTRQIVRTWELAEAVLKRADRQVDIVLVVGGMTRLAAVQKALADRFGAVPRIVADVDAVARGAVLFGMATSAEKWEKAERRANLRGGLPVGGPLAAEQPATVAPAAAAQPAAGWAAIFMPLIEEAEQLESQRRYGETVGRFEELFQKLARFSNQVYRRVAVHLRDQGRMADALRILRKANERDPHDRYVVADLMILCQQEAEHALKVRQPHEAIAFAECGCKAIRALPDGTKYCRDLARLLFLKARGKANQQDGEEAMRLLEVCCRNDPSEPLYKRELDRLRAALRGSSQGWKRSAPQRTITSMSKRGRNDDCPCGSGKKYKKCCGRP